MLYKIQNGAVSCNGDYILEDIEFELKDNEKIGIVGRNGSGKTTLLSALVDNKILEEGIGDNAFKVIKIGEFKIGYLKQIEFEDVNNCLLDELLKSFKELIDIEKKLKYLENNLDNISNIKLYNDNLYRYELLGGYTYKKELAIMIEKFGFSDNDKLKKINEFSGGQKIKIALMKLLLSNPDILILDEPTNHLDVDAIIWLENFLKKYKRSIIVVSHDRMFLNNIVNVIYDIDYGKTVRYSGNYSNFEKLKKEKYEKELKDYDYQQKEIKRLTNIYEKFRSKPKKAKMALSKLKQIERMDYIERPNKEDSKTFKVNLSNIIQSGKKVIEINDLSIGYDKILQTINLVVNRGKKIGIIGKNGSGKSTFLKTLINEINSLKGEFIIGHNVRYGYFDQNLAMKNNNNTILEEFMQTHPDLTENISRSALGSFLFKGEDVLKKVNVLSGGEKVRLELCKLLYKKPNFLLLDEPTNHMDIISKEYFENILIEYPGTILFISHDRYLVKKVATDLLVFDDNSVIYYPGTYDEYLENVVNKSFKKEVEVKVKRKSNYSNNKLIKQIENRIDNVEKQIKLLNNSLYDKSNYSDIKKLNEINLKISKLNSELENLYNKWDELN